MIRLDGQGHHPRVRPETPNRKREFNKSKTIRRITLTIRQWPLIKMIWGSAIDELSDMALEEPMCMDLSCGEVRDCGVTQANPSRPPPKHLWTQRIMRYAAVIFMGALMAFFTACHKDPNPAPQPEPTPTDTVQPIIPTKEIVIHWNWDAIIGWAPPKDTIKYYTDQDSVKTVDINIIGRDGIGFPINCTGYFPCTFRDARDSLQTRIDIDPSKVKLSGTIVVNSKNGATLTDHNITQESGMAIYDSVWFVYHGCLVRRPPHGK